MLVSFWNITTRRGCLIDLRSAYRAYHSTKTADVKMLAGILRAFDTDLAVLTLLDLLAAFDTVDHATLLRQLEVSYGLRGHVLSWFHSYLNGAHSMSVVAQLLPPSLFFCAEFHRGRSSDRSCSCYIRRTCLRLVDKYQLCSHLYADDTQIYSSAIHVCRVFSLYQQHRSSRAGYLRVSMT